MDSYEFLRNGIEESVIFEKHCSQFLDRMRHSSSFDIVQRVKTFVSEFVGTQATAEEASQTVRDFVEEMSQAIAEHPLWREEDEEAVNWATEALERYIMNKLYKVTFYLPSTNDVEEDEKFYHRVRTLQFLKEKHLDIPHRVLNKVATEMAAEELAKLDDENCTSPREKLTYVLNCVIILSNLLKHYDQEKGTGADDLLPYLIYTILLLSPKHIQSNLRYVNRFRRESQMKSEAAYYFTQMESATMFIMEVNHKNLSISEEDFKSGIEKTEELIASGLDLHHFVPGTTSHARPRLSSIVDTSPASSPILSRRATVLEEWSQLQRSHSLSRSEPEKERTVSLASSQRSDSVDGTPTTSPISEVTIPREMKTLPDQTTTRSVSGSSFELESSNLDDKQSEGDKVFVQKFLTTRFEELTVAELRHLYTSYKTLAQQVVTS